MNSSKMAESETDTRLIEYIEALKVGDINSVIFLRQSHPDLKTRFETVEQINSGLLDLFSHEIQILRLEIEGWKAICDSHDSESPKVAKQCARRGREKLDRARVFRASHSKIKLAKLSRSP